ncbi:hypothetical protein [Paraburkholderia fynbosensis]|uniref:Uncharacterized protein n=1 Tax=Paraburkholderia fynbosensis TaxID=1200993 RepID=A0A6J5FTC7_9BURK|nr:hypothetical protein [Paraburkholderia fynbosensis]CAB3785169.1 hypothetical protein LMG27177_01778 [Paraburkholderia fynbosensis]
MLQPGGFGSLRVDQKIAAPRQSTAPTGERHVVIGGRFVGMPGVAGHTLLRVVTPPEAKRQALLPRR